MKRNRIIIFPCILMFLILSLSFSAFCEENDFRDENKMTDELLPELYSSLDENTKNILSEFGFDNIKAQTALELSLKDILSVLKNEFKLQMSENIAAFFRLTGALLLIIIIKSFGKSEKHELLDDVFSMLVILFVSLLISETVRVFVAVLKITGKFMSAFIPVITVLLSFSGNITFSAFYSTMMVGLCEGIIFTAENFAVPFCGIYFALIFSMNFNEITDSNKITSAVNSFFTASLGVVSTVFSLLLSAKNVLSRDIDGVLYKSGKYLISSFVPIVGNAVSGILGSVIASVGIVKSTVGIFIIVSAVCINIPLFIKLFFCRFTLSAVSFIGNAFGEKNTASMIRSISKSMKLITVFAFFVLIMLIVSTGLTVNIRSLIQ